MTLQSASRRIQSMLMDFQHQHHVLTPNPEMLVAAHSDAEFQSVFQGSSLNIPDGFGLILASRLLGNSLPERVSGVDLLSELCSVVRVPVFFLGAAPGIAERAAAALWQHFPDLDIAGTYAGSPHHSEEQGIIARIHASGASLLFVAYGAPSQDLWIARNLSRMPNVRVAMGVGGAFDFLAGVSVRAPIWMQSFGLEWLWRLLQEPRRFRRICRAVIVFPLLFLRYEWRRILRSV